MSLQEQSSTAIISYYSILTILIVLTMASIPTACAKTVTWHYNHTCKPHNPKIHPDQQLHLSKLYNDEKKLLINIDEQQLYCINAQDKLIKTYPISSGLRGTGERHKSYKTPRGWLMVCGKYGENHCATQHFKARVPCKQKTGITSRILTLDGLQSHNKNSLKRCIYIHGTPATQSLGKEARSEGCIRMHPEDIKELYNYVEKGTAVYIYDSNNPLPWQQPTSS